MSRDQSPLVRPHGGNHLLALTIASGIIILAQLLGGTKWYWAASAFVVGGCFWYYRDITWSKVVPAIRTGRAPFSFWWRLLLAPMSAILLTIAWPVWMRDSIADPATKQDMATVEKRLDAIGSRRNQGDNVIINNYFRDNADNLRAMSAALMRKYPRGYVLIGLKGTTFEMPNEFNFLDDFELSGTKIISITPKVVTITFRLVKKSQLIEFNPGIHWITSVRLRTNRPDASAYAGIS